MKQFFIVMLAVMSVNFLQAQNVGIGTAAPNAKAALEISSTTKGLLIPSMTTSQRLAITSATPAPSGLMVYDTDRDEFYHYNGSTWSPMLNGSYWTRPIANRKRISNTLDSVGIGTVSPTEWLDVDGNIRARNNLIIDNDINATGNITSSADLIVNNTTAIMQLKSSNVNKGYFQLSGDNVRMGTNSGNSSGNLIIRMNGNDRVTINPAGDIDLDGKITRSAVTGANSLLPACFGLVGYDGAIISGSGNFTVVHNFTGTYTITCSQLNILSVPLITSLNPTINVSAYQSGPTSVEVNVRNGSGNPFDGGFALLIYKTY